MGIFERDKEHEQDAAPTTSGESTPYPDVDLRTKQPDITRPASFADPAGPDASGTFDVPGAVEPPVIPAELFQLPTVDAARLFLEAARTAPNLKAEGEPKRSAKNQAHYIKSFIQHLAQALERI